MLDERDFQAAARRIARNAGAVHSPANDEQIDAVGFGHVNLRTFSGAEPGRKTCMLLNHRIFSHDRKSSAGIGTLSVRRVLIRETDFQYELDCAGGAILRTWSLTAPISAFDLAAPFTSVFFLRRQGPRVDSPYVR